ncbi:MAG: hypothetical protein GY749_13770 [Desulfobacteraceae bacterium]|nr:hypothetical protein [Desulfobacteraceae bacterium]
MILTACWMSGFQDHYGEEEEAEKAFPRDFIKGNILPVFTPPGMEEAAARLQEYIDKGEL